MRQAWEPLSPSHNLPALVLWQVCPPGIPLSLPFPFLPLGLVFLLPFVPLLASHSFSHSHLFLSTLIFLSIFFFLFVYFYLLPFLLGLLGFVMSAGLPAIRGENSLFPWWLRKKCSALLASPVPLSRFCSLAAHYELQKQRWQECVVWWLDRRGGGQRLGLSPACFLFCCLTPGTSLTLSSSLPLCQRGVCTETQQLRVQTVPAGMVIIEP